MKRLSIAYFLLLISLFTYSQSEIDLNGIYLDSRDTLNFHKNSVSFQIMSNGGLIYPMNGTGKFRISDNILTIKTLKNVQQDKLSSKEPRDLGDKEFIENKTLIFIINDFEKDFLNLTLIGIINNSEFHENKTIRKFMKEHKKLKFRERKLYKN
jgi:hypothetical protein